MFLCGFNKKIYNLIYFSGLLSTTPRKLDRENQPEHILEVRLLLFNFIKENPLK